MVYNINTIEIIIHCIHYISIINTHIDKSVIQIIITSNKIHCIDHRRTSIDLRIRSKLYFFHNYIIINKQCTYILLLPR